MVSESRIKTNHCLMKAFDLNDFLNPNKLTHDELQYYNNLTRALDQTIDKYVDWLGTPDAQKVFYENDKYAEEFFDSIDLELDEIINDTSLSVDKIVEKIYNKGLNQGYKDIRRRFHFSDACKYGLKATQEYNFELIRNVSDDLRDTIKHHIFRGVAEGQSIHEVARAITDSGLEPLHGKSMSAYQRASLIAHTEIARSMTTGRLQAYANYGVKKVKILTAGDDHVCPICLKAAHKFNGEMSIENVSGDKLYNLEDASDLVPFHPACRCSVMAYIEHYQLPEKPIENPKIMCCSPLKRIGNTNFNAPKVDPQTEFEEISKKGFIEYTDNNGRRHKVKVRCKESSIVNFEEEVEIGEKFADEECYLYQILDDAGKNVSVNIYKSKTHNQFSMEHLISIYDNLNKKLISECTEIVLSNHEFTKSKTGGYVHPSNPHRVYIMGITTPYHVESILIHEMAHSFDISNGYISSSEGYKKLVPKNMLVGKEEDVRHDLAEDFAYSIEYLFKDGFVDLSDDKTKYLYKLLGIF